MDYVLKRENALFSRRIIVFPISNVLFRPEEVHRASRIGKSLHPFGEWNRNQSHDSVRIGF
jgi:hypothetical protein